MILKISPYLLFLQGVWELYILARAIIIGFDPAMYYLVGIVAPYLLITTLMLVSGYGIMRQKRWALITYGVAVVLPTIFPFARISIIFPSFPTIVTTYLLTVLNASLATYLFVQFWEKWKQSSG